MRQNARKEVLSCMSRAVASSLSSKEDLARSGRLSENSMSSSDGGHQRRDGPDPSVWSDPANGMKLSEVRLDRYS
jgi:hypothetical protein